MSPPSLDLLRAFQAVYRTGSVTAAAHLLSVSQPTVTHQVQALERACGRALFVRQPRGVVATPAGDALAGRLGDHLDSLTAVAADLGGQQEASGRTLHMGGPAELLVTLAVPVLADLIAAGVRVRVQLGLAEALLAQLANGSLDLVISTIRPRGRGIAGAPLCDEEFVLVAAPETAARLDPGLLATQSARALASVPVVGYSEGLPIVRRYWRHVFRAPFAGPVALVLPDLRGVREAVVAGVGMSVLPRYLCEAELQDGRLLALLDPDDAPINTLYLAVRPGTEGQPHIELASAVLRDRAATW